MPVHHEGGCLCGALRYAVSEAPARLSYCTCRFCQKMTGTPMNALASFARQSFALLAGEARTYTHLSEGSGKALHLKSCPVCASTVFVELERFPGVVGVMTGTLDDPDWFDRTPENSKYIFTDCAQSGTVVQAGFPVFGQHAATADGTPCAPEVRDRHWRVR